MAHQEAAPAEAQRHPALGGSWALVKRMHERGQMKAWTYTPLLGGERRLDGVMCACLFTRTVQMSRRHRC